MGCVEGVSWYSHCAISDYFGAEVNWRALLWWMPPAMLRTVILNVIKEDVAYQGVLWSSRGGWLTFKDVHALRQGAEPAKMDGDMVIHRERVDFLQVLP